MENIENKEEDYNNIFIKLTMKVPKEEEPSFTRKIQ